MHAFIWVPGRIPSAAFAPSTRGINATTSREKQHITAQRRGTTRQKANIRTTRETSASAIVQFTGRKPVQKIVVEGHTGFAWPRWHSMQPDWRCEMHLSTLPRTTSSLTNGYVPLPSQHPATDHSILSARPRTLPFSPHCHKFSAITAAMTVCASCATQALRKYY